MSNKYISDIILEYEKLRSSAEEDAKRRLYEVYKKIPRIKEIDRELGALGLEIARSVFKKGIDIEKLIGEKRHRAMDLKIEKAELLTQNHYPLNYTDPIYNCSRCHDTGYVGSERCSCFKQKLINLHYNQSNLKDIVSRENFDTFVLDYYSIHKFEDEALSPRKNMEEIFTACINFVKNFDTDNENLFFYGKSGLGKTFLSNCIAKDLLDNGKLVVYQTSSNLIDILKAARFDNTNEDADNICDDIFNCDLLIIDDLGTEYLTEFSQMELFNIINRRLISNKKMILSTNFSLDNIYKAYPERITSRIFGNFTMYKFYGEDIRVKIAEQKRRKNKR